MNEPGRYKAFISYAHRDSGWATRLQRKLEGFNAPQHSGARWPLRPIFLDRSELGSSPNLSDSIEHALRSSDALIVVCSPAAAASKWVNAEILFYKRLGNTAIFPIVIAGEPGATDAESTCFPDALRFKLRDDGELSTLPAEPLAADARRGRDGSDAILKLASGLLNIPFDTLKLRQHKRRMRQLIAAGAAGTAVLILTSYLAIAAMAARQAAEQSRNQAESLISFMLGDLRERLEPVGRLDVLDAVGEQALEYFSRLGDAELDSESLLNRAKAMRQIGEVRAAQGLTDAGIEAFSEALTLLNEPRGIDEASRLFELGQINYWMADAHFQALEIDEAQSYIDEYLNISRRLVDLEPDNAIYRMELLYAESNLGTLAFRRNDLTTARRYFERALAEAEELVARDASPDNLFELATTISWFGAIEASIGNLAAAMENYAEEVRIYREIIETDNTPGMLGGLGNALWLLADTMHHAGQLERAVDALEESVQLYSELAAYDPQNFAWQRGLAWTLTLLARDRFAAGLDDATAAITTLNLAGQAMIGANDDIGTESTRVRASIAIERARIELVDGSPDVAAEFLSRAVLALEPLIISDDRMRILPVYARARYLAAETALAVDGLAASKLEADAALDALDLRDDDSVVLRAYAALLAFRAQRPEADQWLTSVAATDFAGPVFLPGSEAEDWWQR